MKRFLVVALLTVSAFAFADATEKWLTSSAKVVRVVTWTLPDGGCAVMATGTKTREDGGTVFKDSKERELTGANQTSCLDIQAKALVLFKTDEGL